jgi:lipopolysaccharide export system permease protein
VPKIPLILSLYLARLFTRWFFIVLLVMVVLVGIFDFAELMRRGANKPLATVPLILEMAFLKLPTIIQRLVPFITLFSTMSLLWQMNRSYELLAIKGAGVSVWQILAPLGAVSLLMNATCLLVLNPLGASMMSRYEQMDATYLKGFSHRVSVGETGFWIRQIDPADPSKGDRGGHTIIHADQVDHDSHCLSKATFVRFNEKDQFLIRLDAEKAYLQKGAWHLSQSWVTLESQPSYYKEADAIPTPLTAQDIMDSAVPPASLSFWQLPSFIGTFQKSGLSVVRHVVYWHGLLARPLFCLAMILLAACFCLRPLRQGQTAFLISMGAGLGFMTYVFSDITLAIGYSSGIPPLLAAWGPPLIAALVGITILLHLEDG